MGFIETIRRRKSVGYGIAGILFLLAIGIGVWARSNGVPANLTKAYYSTDDGKTFFVDDLNKPYPFEHDGKLAYRAYVYEEADDVPKVAYLERYTARGLARKEELTTQPVNDGGAEAAKLLLSETEAKKPGMDQWIPASSPMHRAVVQPEYPMAHGVYP
jgi:hypothetical protein